ncbi:uncharacterized protein LOC103705919 isoform X2 [Phoenix dactylifera]|uniref:Uncharacterized protein LOC103705919 isoform X2 n=1 Tax=Phoenix dactylifera TaxID=42345 RepID=A0A8B7BYJ1_PHODC|nr:uncharacterized protein LOC103705919 isoform X2 [Phoenix dactylifera]
MDGPDLGGHARGPRLQSRGELVKSRGVPNIPVLASLRRASAMAYRRKHGAPKATTFEDFRSTPPQVPEGSLPSSPSLAAQAIRASAAHRDSSLSSAYGESAFSSAYRDSNRPRSPQGSNTYRYTSIKSLNEPQHGFWGILARKAKEILEDDNAALQFDEHGRNQLQMVDSSTGAQFHRSYSEGYRKAQKPALHKGSDSIASSLNHIGGTIRNALEEGLTIVENRTADIIQETRKLQIRRKASGSSARDRPTDTLVPNTLSQIQTDQETQLKASRDVANAMAAKAKLLLRELKTVKADLAFAKQRCSQFEEENKILRESREKGTNHEDDDLIRLQLETLLTEKARLANENSLYARENRFLMEIVEYHQLTMQDVVYLDEGVEEVYQIPPHSSPSRSAPEFPSPVLSITPSPSPDPAFPSSPKVSTPRTPTNPASAPKIIAKAVTPDIQTSPLETSPEAEGPKQQEIIPSPSSTVEGPRQLQSPTSPA